MIGIYAILLDFAFVALGLFMLASVSWELISCLRRKPGNTFSKNDRRREPWELVGVVVLAVLWLAFVSDRFLGEARFHRELSYLQPETVDRIEIANQVVTDKRQITEIIFAINHPEWYSMRRGDSADKVSFVVSLASGKQYKYEAARYLRGEGAALISQSPSGWSNGEVLCRHLPTALKQAAVTLPNCFTYFGKPEHCAMP